MELAKETINAYIKEKKNLYVKEITRCEDLFIGYKDMITNCNLKGKKYVDAQRILKKLKTFSQQNNLK